jgi:hypothetical protein
MALKIKSLAEPGRYPDGGGLFLDVNGKGSGRWLSGFNRTAGGGTSASDRGELPG